MSHVQLLGTYVATEQPRNDDELAEALEAGDVWEVVAGGITKICWEAGDLLCLRLFFVFQFYCS